MERVDGVGAWASTGTVRFVFLFGESYADGSVRSNKSQTRIARPWCAVPSFKSTDDPTGAGGLWLAAVSD